MFRNLAIASLTVATALVCSPAASAQRITKTTTLQGWVWCKYFSYDFTIDNSGGANFIGSFEVEFPAGFGDLDPGSISEPAGWVHTVVPPAPPAPGKIVFTGAFGARVAPGGTLGGFSIDTNCSPRVVEGMQDYRMFIPGGAGGLPAGRGLCSYSPGAGSNHLYGDAAAAPGSRYLLAVTDIEAANRQAMFVLGVPMPLPIPLPGFGELWMDPGLIVPLGSIPLDAAGNGSLVLPVPPNPNLVGVNLMLQSLTVAGGPELSNGWLVSIR